LEFFAWNDGAGAIGCTITSVEFGLSGHGVVDIARATHAVLARVLAPHLRPKA